MPSVEGSSCRSLRLCSTKMDRSSSRIVSISAYSLAHYAVSKFPPDRGDWCDPAPHGDDIWMPDVAAMNDAYEESRRRSRASERSTILEGNWPRG